MKSVTYNTIHRSHSCKTSLICGKSKIRAPSFRLFPSACIELPRGVSPVPIWCTVCVWVIGMRYGCMFTCAHEGGDGDGVFRLWMEYGVPHVCRSSSIIPKQNAADSLRLHTAGVLLLYWYSSLPSYRSMVVNFTFTLFIFSLSQAMAYSTALVCALAAMIIVASAQSMLLTSRMNSISGDFVVSYVVALTSTHSHRTSMQL